MIRPVDARTDQYVEDVVALDPIIATSAGIAGHDDRLPDLSPSGYDAREELNRRALAEVAAIDPTDERERIAQEAFVERIGLELERAESGFERSAFSVISSALHAVREVFDLMPTATEDDWRTIGDRLAAVPEALTGYRSTLEVEAAAGRVSARRQYVEVAGQVRGWTGQVGAAGDYFGNLVAAAPDGLRDALAEVATRASASYADFGRFVETDLAPQGRESDGVGRDRYVLQSRYFLGAEVDLEETYRWGWEELRRIEDDMVQTARRIVPGGS